MLQGIASAAPSGSSSPTTNLLSVITAAGLAASLAASYDAGSVKSFPASGQPIFLDENGSVYFLFRGADATLGAGAPSFHGTPGNLSNSEYFTVNGSQYFQAQTQPPFATNAHKANATWSYIIGYYIADTTDANSLFGDDANLGTGIHFVLTSAAQHLIVFNGASVVLQKIADVGAAAGWHFLGGSFNGAGGAGTGFFYRDGNYDQVSSANTFDATYSSPSAGASAATFNLLALGANGTQPVPTGSRLMFFAFFTTNLSKANMDTLFASLRARLGI